MGLATPDRSNFVDINRMRLRTWEWGDEAKPVVICAHGGSDHGRMWDGLAPRLADLGYHVVAPDLRGHGDSSRIASGQIWSACALDIALLARHYGAPVGFVGHSFGAGQVMWVASVWPELARWVVSLDGLGPPPAAFAPRNIAEVATAGLNAIERSMSRPPRVYATRDDMIERRRQANPRLPQEWLEHLVEYGSRPVEGGYIWKAEQRFGIGLVGDFSLEHLFAEQAMLTRPVLALTGGEHDTWSDLTPDEIAQRIAPMHDVRHHVIDGAGHYVHLEQPDCVFAYIEAFITEVGP